MTEQRSCVVKHTNFPWASCATSYLSKSELKSLCHNASRPDEWRAKPRLLANSLAGHPKGPGQ
jgi:hypothetical protein